MGVTHLLLDRLGYLPDKLLEPAVSEWIQKCPDATLYQNDVSRVVDFIRLAACSRSPRASTKN
jgi:hypothetical protein